jgi:hypothetical protein
MAFRFWAGIINRETRRLAEKRLNYILGVADCDEVHSGIHRHVDAVGDGIGIVGVGPWNCKGLIPTAIC